MNDIISLKEYASNLKLVKKSLKFCKCICFHPLLYPNFDDKTIF